MSAIKAADLFCGAGGITNGLKDAAAELGMKVSLLAINHWDIAIMTHSENHPDVMHLCTGVDHVDPRVVVPDGYLDILVAGPQCTFFSRARGGRPVDDQQRVSPWLVLDWLEKLDVRNVLIENVPELMKWGPVDPQTGRPIKRLEGKTFLAYIRALRSLDYNVSYRVVNCADYGDATTRERLFIMARKGRRVRWPEPTHVDPAEHTGNGKQVPMFNHGRPWRTAREIIDWGIPGTSIYQRKKPLAENTLRKIWVGLEKISGLPFILKHYGTNDVSAINNPLPAITAQGKKYALFEPFIKEYHGGDGCERRVRSVEDPLPTQDTSNRFALAEPFIFKINHGQNTHRAYSIDEPLRTVTSVDAWGLAQPFIVKFYGNGVAQSIDDPLHTVTTKDRFGLAQPVVFQVGEQFYMLDILFRMLLPHELAAAMSFPADYKFHGSRSDIVKQIGNAVPRRTARALCKALLS